MTSRFFAASDSDSSSEESSAEELYSDQEESEEESSEEGSDDGDGSDDSDSGDGGGASKFLRDGASESESDGDEDGAKVLKSAKDKRFEELEGTVRSIENAEKIGDWALIQDCEFANRA